MPARRKTGQGDAAHRGEASASASEAAARLRHFTKATSCRDREDALRAAAEALAEANAHRSSLHTRTVEDVALGQRLRDLDSAYQRSWERLRRRCRR